jgi:hypothetical protein
MENITYQKTHTKDVENFQIATKLLSVENNIFHQRIASTFQL